MILPERTKDKRFTTEHTETTEVQKKTEDGLSRFFSAQSTTAGDPR
jgi:hypothetical protein